MDIQENNPSFENEKITTDEQEVNDQHPEKNNKNKTNPLTIMSVVLNVVLVVAVVVLYILHFSGNKQSQSFYAPVPEGTPGSGEIVYVNIDTINKYYKLVDILTNDIEAEQKRHEATFTNRQKALENKYNQFQKNYEANILTPVQIQNAQAQLVSEDEALRRDYEQVLGNLQARQIAALQQIADSLVHATNRINAQRNASYVLSYQYGSQILTADPTKDITTEVLHELNKYYEK